MQYCLLKYSQFLEILQNFSEYNLDMKIVAERIDLRIIGILSTGANDRQESERW